MLITVFDFDDTIFATTFLTEQSSNSPIIYEGLAESINKIISVAEQYGKVFIITNATLSWMKICLNLYIPTATKLANLIESKCFLSTLDSGISDKVKFAFRKTVAFNSVLFQFFQDGEKHHLISFGDSYFDRIAALSIKETFKNVIVKNIFMVQRPDITSLLKQHEFISICFEYLVDQQEHLDTMIEIKGEDPLKPFKDENILIERGINIDELKVDNKLENCSVDMWAQLDYEWVEKYM